MMLPYFGTEIIPRIGKPEVWRKGFEAGNPCEARAVVEAQMASMANHAAWLGEKPARVQATGGASENPAILQIMADMLEVPVIRQETSASAALGAAIRAWQAVAAPVHAGLTWKAITEPHVTAAKEVFPRREAVETYRPFKMAYAEWEAEAVLALK
jgi:xylulokinase